MNLENKDTLKKYFELSDRVLKLIDEQAEYKMARGDLQGVVEAIIMDAMNFREEPPIDPTEKSLREIWDKKGVSKE